MFGCKFVCVCLCMFLCVNLCVYNSVSLSERISLFQAVCEFLCL